MSMQTIGTTLNRLQITKLSALFVGVLLIFKYIMEQDFRNMFKSGIKWFQKFPRQFRESGKLTLVVIGQIKIILTIFLNWITNKSITCTAMDHPELIQLTDYLHFKLPTRQKYVNHLETNSENVDKTVKKLLSQSSVSITTDL